MVLVLVFRFVVLLETCGLGIGVEKGLVYSTGINKQVCPM